MQVELYKKTGTYQDKASGKDKQFVNFYVKCGDVLVPVTVCYFENEEGRDFQYNGRKQVLFDDTVKLVLPRSYAQGIERKQ